MLKNSKLLFSTINQVSRRALSLSSISMTKALVLGLYQRDKEDPVLTSCASCFDSKTEGKLKKLVLQHGPDKKGKAKIYYDLSKDYPVVSVVGLGSPDAGYKESEGLDEKRENVRASMAIGTKSVREELGVEEIHVDPCGDAEAAAEGAVMSVWQYDELKSEKYKKKPVKLDLCEICSDTSTREAWQRGTTLAMAQNVCRRFAEMPASHMTPTVFGSETESLLKGLPNVKVVVHDKQWAESKKMGSFLSVAKGSAEPPKFVEIHYNNKPNTKPFVMVGKGICFDSGGISLKAAAGMDKMRYDMGGAANVVATIYALASLKAEVNVVGLTPLCENLPSGTANKPGDVVTAMNGKTIQVDNTDAEGRLILADGLCYAHEFDPQAVLDIATLTGAMGIALGSAASGVFCTDNKLYETLREAGVHTGDRVWRMPLFEHYKNHVTNPALADLLNMGKVARAAGSCTAAAFLAEFVKCPKWVHIDIAGVMENSDDAPYYCKGMSGRPVRTLFYMMSNYFKNN